ncbi:MAG: carbonic anhydrase family protein [Rubrivivax sp.]|nr:carbonic anhydrase family protein [Rubrivivax sp.]
MTPSPPRHRVMRRLALPIALLAAPAIALASDPATGPEVVANAPAAVDPMTLLRARLEEKLGAQIAPDAKGTHELRVPAQAPAVSAAKGGGSAELAARVADHRASKRATNPDRAPHWGYEGEAGPAKWADLTPDYTLCARGERQSPIDIRDGIAVDLAPVTFDYRPSGFSVIDNGHTVQVNLSPGSAIEVMGRRYELVQFHFHRPSEERINGRQYEMSAHLVHKDPDGRLAVVAVLLERGAAQPVIQQVWNNLPLEKGEPVPAPHEMDPAALLPTDRRYYTYMGSLTTPPCTEGVLWMVMQQPVPASTQQIGIFQRLYPMNARPVQAAAGRLIKQSN